MQGSEAIVSALVAAVCRRWNRVASTEPFLNFTKIFLNLLLAP